LPVEGVLWLCEEYRIEVVVAVKRGGAEEEAKDVFTRAGTLAAAEDAAVRSDPSLGANVQICYPSAHDWRLQWEPTIKGWVCQITIELYVKFSSI
jgi:hypothetical protein